MQKSVLLHQLEQLQECEVLLSEERRKLEEEQSIMESAELKEQSLRLHVPELRKFTNILSRRVRRNHSNKSALVHPSAIEHSPQSIELTNLDSRSKSVKQQRRILLQRHSLSSSARGAAIVIRAPKSLAMKHSQNWKSRSVVPKTSMQEATQSGRTSVVTPASASTLKRHASYLVNDVQAATGSNDDSNSNATKTKIKSVAPRHRRSSHWQIDSDDSSPEKSASRSVSNSIAAQIISDPIKRVSLAGPARRSGKNHHRPHGRRRHRHHQGGKSKSASGLGIVMYNPSKKFAAGGLHVVSALRTSNVASSLPRNRRKRPAEGAQAVDSDREIHTEDGSDIPGVAVSVDEGVDEFL